MTKQEDARSYVLHVQVFSAAGLSIKENLLKKSKGVHREGKPIN